MNDALAERKQALQAIWFILSFPGNRWSSMKIVYPTKVVLAWAEAINGNKVIRDWLIGNGYPELGLFVYALHLKQDARDWLMNSGHAHLMALIHAAEGNRSALLWLKKHDLDVLEKMALAADNDDEALLWLMRNDLKDMAIVAQRMREVKNEIERRNSDLHFISWD
ncbi:MAG: hypothetical protein ACK5XV_00350 [Flavobacteriales bacterium]|jgi:hypothetical protein